MTYKLQPNKLVFVKLTRWKSAPLHWELQLTRETPNWDAQHVYIGPRKTEEFHLEGLGFFFFGFQHNLTTAGPGRFLVSQEHHRCPWDGVVQHQPPPLKGQYPRAACAGSQGAYLSPKLSKIGPDLANGNLVAVPRLG